MTDVGVVGKQLSWQLRFIWINSSPYIRLLIVFKHTSGWTVFLLLYSGRSFNLVFSSCCSFAPHGSVRRVCLFLCHCLGRTQHVNFNKGLHERAKHWSFFLHLFHAIQFSKTLSFMMGTKVWCHIHKIMRVLKCISPLDHHTKAFELLKLRNMIYLVGNKIIRGDCSPQIYRFTIANSLLTAFQTDFE